MKMKICGIFLFAFLLITSCAPPPALAPTATLTPAPTATSTIVPTPIPTPTPGGYQKYHIELGVESSSLRIWMPAPRYWDGQSIRKIEYQEISPDPSDWFREENGTEVLYWENPTRKKQTYQIIFDVEMVFIDNSDAEEIEPQPYVENSYIFQKYTQPSDDIQSDSEQILALAKSIIKDEVNPYQQAKLLQSWIVKNIQYVPGDRDALSTFVNKGSDCVGRAQLYVALLRANRIPARNVSGIHSPGNQYLKSGNWYPDKSMGYHVWTEFYLEGYGWIQVEPSQQGRFGTLMEHRIVTSKGNDLTIGNNFPEEKIYWFHLPYDVYSQIENNPLWFYVTKVQ